MILPSFLHTHTNTYSLNDVHWVNFVAKNSTAPLAPAQFSATTTKFSLEHSLVSSKNCALQKWKRQTKHWRENNCDISFETWIPMKSKPIVECKYCVAMQYASMFETFFFQKLFFYFKFYLFYLCNEKISKAWTKSMPVDSFLPYFSAFIIELTVQFVFGQSVESCCNMSKHV